MGANDIQFGGDHYKTQGLQHWDLMALGHVPYLEGNASKYGYRWPKKNGLEDVEKFGHYVLKVRELHKTQGYQNTGDLDMDLWLRFCAENNLSRTSTYATSLILDWRNEWQLDECLDCIRVLRSAAGE